MPEQEIDYDEELAAFIDIAARTGRLCTSGLDVYVAPYVPTWTCQRHRLTDCPMCIFKIHIPKPWGT